LSGFALLVFDVQDLLFASLEVCVVVDLVLVLFELEDFPSRFPFEDESLLDLLLLCCCFVAGAGIGIGSGRNRIWDLGGGGNGLYFGVDVDGWDSEVDFVGTGGFLFLGGQKGLLGWNFFFGMSGSSRADGRFREPVVPGSSSWVATSAGLSPKHCLLDDSGGGTVSFCISSFSPVIIPI
jgi:hypothetical protein